MKRFLSVFLMVLSANFYMLPSFAADPLCIALTNFGEKPVFISGRISNNNEEHLVKPGESATLTINEMSRSCSSRGCELFVIHRSNNNQDQSHMIKQVPRGARIIYKNKDLYYINEHAGVLCIK